MAHHHGAFGPDDNFPIPPFWESNFTEPSVQAAIRDYCRPGDSVFDVGANSGALSMVMSRLVGPRGIVCAFEASPRIIGKTHHNLVKAGCTNTTLYHRAVYHRSHDFVRLFAGTHLNDSLYNDCGVETGVPLEVETLALDDFVEASGLMPRFIKMDIEGAEYDALCGAGRILAEGQPTLVLEQSPGDWRCHDLLTRAGYRAVDLATYRAIRTPEDFAPGVGVANVVFVHESRAAADPYVHAGEPVTVAQLQPSAFDIAANGKIMLKEPLSLKPGRYLCRAHFTAEGTDNEIFCGIDSERGREMRYHAYSKLIAGSYRDWIFALRGPRRVTPFIEFIRGTDPTLVWRGATLLRYPSFDRVPPPILS